MSFCRGSVNCHGSDGQMYHLVSFHLSLSVAHSSLIFQAFMSLLTVSFHLDLGLPLGRFPSIFILATALMFFCLISSLPEPFQPSHNHCYRFHKLLHPGSHLSNVPEGSHLPIAPSSYILLPYAFHLFN